MKQVPDLHYKDNRNNSHGLGIIVTRVAGSFVLVVTELVINVKC